MKTFFGIVFAIVALQLSAVCAGSFHSERQPEDEDPAAVANMLAEEVNKESENAKEAAASARTAAAVANKVAEHSIHIIGHSKKALKNALGALHDARVDSQGLDRSQKNSLKKAEAKLREATKNADYGKLKKVKTYQDVTKEKMQVDLEKQKKTSTEVEDMQVEVRELRSKLKEKGGDAESDKALAELEVELEKKKTSETTEGGESASTNDEMKAEIERLRIQVDKMEEQKEGQVDYDISKKGKVHELPKKAQGQDDKELMRDVKMEDLEDGKVTKVKVGTTGVGGQYGYEVTPVEEKGIDVDTQMPYGDLEPFGREDTAQELTENSVRESDEMVDQLERAEVAEEKRAVFRALTRLRGAAITSFDGVARSQTGNIDEYNKVNKWRKVHPLHHLADEESDISKWAFPDNADLIQFKGKGELETKTQQDSK
jgi:hypothetical protein